MVTRTKCKNYLIIGADKRLKRLLSTDYIEWLVEQVRYVGSLLIKNYCEAAKNWQARFLYFFSWY